MGLLKKPLVISFVFSGMNLFSQTAQIGTINSDFRIRRYNLDKSSASLALGPYAVDTNTIQKIKGSASVYIKKNNENNKDREVVLEKGDLVTFLLTSPPSTSAGVIQPYDVTLNGKAIKDFIIIKTNQPDPRCDGALTIFISDGFQKLLRSMGNSYFRENTFGSI